MAELSGRAIVDANVAVKWVISEVGSDYAATLARYRLSAPDLFDAECANVLWVKVARREITKAEALSRIARLAAAPVDRVPCRELSSSALKLSIDLKHPAYDCLYLALAIRMSAPMVTADKKFLATVAAHPYLAPHVIGLTSVPMI